MVHSLSHTLIYTHCTHTHTLHAHIHSLSAAFGKAGAAVGASVFLKITNMYCPGHDCRASNTPELADKGIRVVFICCTVFAALGFLWTWALVTDKPDETLKEIESIYDVEIEKPGEVAALEMAIQKAHSISNTTAPPTAEEEAKVAAKV